ncbi:thiamine pyrophosphate-dependent enzyme [Parafannyhessea umbonata]|uniref:Indolepyruvate oxidoreductase subunit IorA n=1 Tax=Parafannyhessea umbonata TaxID=604330 RepID=A0A1G6J922_9ACTN|nr:thiamine pyrophosphate-dependent enzyme [Parafannyhessea umbonata]SDC15169.1 indolepyruvate ferredoxin oxidoreductase alpha subunit [Parafannyhessea umbonata]
MAKQLLSGNEAIAQGAWEAGVRVGTGYPGTPSTETLENLVRHKDVYCEWSPNEKVALEVGIGSAMAGARTLVTMKHVGVNVAADPFMSVANTGVNAGLVVLAADDPSCYSSQNEQDSRTYAAFARIPCLDPADSQEAYEFSRKAFALSERFDTPVMLHETMRIAHTRTMVEPAGVREDAPFRDYASAPQKYVMMPAFAVGRIQATNAREDALVQFAEKSELNRVEMRDTSIGVIVAGALYNHVREALPNASTFKLGLTWPLPPERLRQFAASVDKVYVVEEACRYFRDAIAAMGVDLSEPPAAPLPRSGEIFPSHIRASFGAELPSHEQAAQDLPPRPPAFCAGCPHRLVFCELRRMHAIVCGDIGCYTLGAVAPYKAVDSVIDMGASFSMAHGMELAAAPERTGRPVVGVIGDSTFAHSGITSLLGTVYNGGTGTLCILDNRTTAMTGTQGNPVNGLTLTEQAARVSPLMDAAQKPSMLDRPAGKPLDLVALCRAIGVDEVSVVDAQDLKAIRRALKAATSHTDRLSVIIFKSPCRLVDRTSRPSPRITDCRKCGSCIQIGCPALGKATDGSAEIDPTQCIGCNQCVQRCPFGCIAFEEE